MNFEEIQNELNVLVVEKQERFIEKIKSIDEFPIIDHFDLKKDTPFLSVPQKEIIRYCQTSGSTGKSKFIPYTKKDVKNAVKAQVRAYIFGGVKRYDRSLSATAYGPWSSGLICQEAGEIIGLTIPADMKLGLDWQLEVIERFRPNYITCVPSFLTYFERACCARKLKPSKLGLKLIFIVGETLSESSRKYFESEFQASIRNMYASTEFGVVASECHAGRLHIWQDFFHIEVINPKTKKSCPSGEVGELVITPLQKEAMSLVRYNTHDLAAIESSPCLCGSTLMGLSPIQGRGDDMFIVSGVHIFPSYFEKAMAGVLEFSSLYEVKISKENGLDEISIQIETRTPQTPEIKLKLADIFMENFIATDPIFSMRIREWKTMAPPKIQIRDPGTLTLLPGKQKKIWDLRTKY